MIYYEREMPKENARLEFIEGDGTPKGFTNSIMGYLLKTGNI